MFFPRRPLPLILVPFALLLTLSACETSAQRAQHSSPDYKVGYEDGCATASTQGANARKDNTVRDDQAYRTNPAYHAGWGTGFNSCRITQTGAGQPGAPGSGPLSAPFAGTP